MNTGNPGFTLEFENEGKFTIIHGQSLNPVAGAESIADIAEASRFESLQESDDAP
jgi:hypothetical protein